jgi:hypothetical protein
MDGVMFGIIIFLAIAGPTLLALGLYWRRNPDRWRRAREASRDADRQPVPPPSWWQPWRSIGGRDSSDGGGGSR